MEKHIYTKLFAWVKYIKIQDVCRFISGSHCIWILVSMKFIYINLNANHSNHFLMSMLRPITQSNRSGKVKRARKITARVEKK